MSFVYRSTTGSTVNVGSYVVSKTGMYAAARVPELDALVGESLARDEEVMVVLEKSPVPDALDQTVSTD